MTVLIYLEIIVTSFKMKLLNQKMQSYFFSHQPSDILDFCYLEKKHSLVNIKWTTNLPWFCTQILSANLFNVRLFFSLSIFSRTYIFSWIASLQMSFRENAWSTCSNIKFNNFLFLSEFFKVIFYKCKLLKSLIQKLILIKEK